MPGEIDEQILSKLDKLKKIAHEEEVEDDENDDLWEHREHERKLRNTKHLHETDTNGKKQEGSKKDLDGEKTIDSTVKGNEEEKVTKEAKNQGHKVEGGGR